MARPKNRRTKKRTAPVSTPAAPAAEKAVIPATPAEEAAAPAEIKEEKTVSDTAPAVVTETKPAAKKKPSAKTEKTETAKKENTFVFQSGGREYTSDEIAELCKAAYRNGTRKKVRSCNVYLKTENGGLRAYYVINGKADGAFIDL